MNGKRRLKMKQLTRLFIPICLETLFYMLSGMVDTLMLSAVGDYAVGAVGTANSYIGIFIIMFSIISSGMVSVMTQNIGAGRPGVAYQARQLGLLFNAVAGVLMAVFLFSGAGAILRMVGIADALYEPALIYLKIVGGGCILNAVIPIFSSYLRAFGYTKQPLYATIVGNIANFVMNAVFLFVLHKGVAGVAAATVISKILNLCIVLYFSHKLISAKNSTERIANKTVLGQIVKVGLPSACETALYNVAMMLVIRFLNQMDAEGLNVTARSYTATISNFSYCVGAATMDIHVLAKMLDTDAGTLNMPARITDTPWTIPFKCLVFKFGFCKPENKIVFIPFIFIFLHIVTHTDLQLFLFDCGRKYKIILQSAGIKINISTGLISISLFKKYLYHVNKFRNAMGCRFYHIRFFDI